LAMTLLLQNVVIIYAFISNRRSKSSLSGEGAPEAMILEPVGSRTAK